MSVFEVHLREGRAEEWEFQVSIPLDCAYFEGHFDDQSVLPAVGQLDLVRELAAAALGGEPWIAAVRRVRFRAPVRPGDRLDARLRLEGGAGGAHFELARSGELVSDGRVRLEHADCGRGA